MALVRWQKKDSDLPTFSNFFDNLALQNMHDFFGNTFMHKTPSCNIRETRDDYIIEMAAPGLKKEDFKISLENNMISIEASKQEESSEKNERYTRKEFSFSSFQRSFNLPNTVEVDRIDARYSDGILQITVPKREEAKRKPTREIRIQ